MALDVTSLRESFELVVERSPRAMAGLMIEGARIAAREREVASEVTPSRKTRELPRRSS